MKFIKEKRVEMFRCYAASKITYNRQTCPLFATEGEGECCFFSGENYEDKHTIWTEPGGTMSVVEIPGKQGEFLAVQNFFPTFQSENATIVWGKSENGDKWAIRTVLKLPYIHRFDILVANGVNYFLGATLCTSKKEKEDWSDPGKLYACKLPDTPDEPFHLEVIMEGLNKNHGYSHVVWNGENAGIVTCESGVFLILPPAGEKPNWRIEQLLDEPTSDVAALDIDCDGELELATISPFHGNTLAIYKKIDGSYKKVYQYPVIEDFYHVIKACTLRGVPTFIGGCRRGDKELFFVQWNKETASFVSQVIDSGVGPSNVDIINLIDKDVIVSANREIGQGVLYFVED
ncbi:MAG: hypothetical protein PHV07_01270 [Oscillospiraceae bacterium]|nr:hypothetical protein [Oscillospiraceae bacterium]